jgi:hypothetical protein
MGNRVNRESPLITPLWTFNGGSVNLRIHFGSFEDCCIDIVEDCQKDLRIGSNVSFHISQRPCSDKSFDLDRDPIMQSTANKPVVPSSPRLLGERLKL